VKKTILPISFLLLTTSFLWAQSKKELLAEVENLKSELTTTEPALAESKKNEKISKTKTEFFETQVTELQEANATLLKNLKIFTEASKQKSDNIGRTLESLREKEAQLKVINDALSRNDSTAIVVLTNAKQTLGEDAKIKVSKGAVVISADQTFMFGGDTNTTVTTAAQMWLEKIAAILLANPDMAITVEGLSMTGELDIAASQAASVAGVLQKQFEITPERITAMGKDGGFTEGIHMKIHPKFDQFYFTVRENMKNSGNN